MLTLGGWALAIADAEGAPTPALGPSKALALVVYLACAPGRAATRERLADLLWADLEPEAAAHALRQTLWYIRQRLGRDAVVSEGSTIRLAVAIASDRDAFLAAVERQDLEGATEIYRGDFLPGFASPGGADFEQWADVERHRLHGLFHHVAETLARRRLAEGRARDAVALARRLRDSDRESEAGWRLLLEAMMAAGDRLGASAEADALGAWLRSQDREPEPATRAAIRITAEAPTPLGAEARSGASTLVAELVGREREFQLVLAAWREGRRDGGRHVHVSGAAGLGKTRLLADLSARLRAGGARVVSVRANPGERRVPYAAASDLAAALAALPGAPSVPPATAGTLVALNPALSSRYPAAPALRSADDDALRHRGIALTELVNAVCDEAPLALLVDDIHWMDAESRQVLAALTAKVGACRGLLVTAGRPTRDPAPEGPRSTTITLAPLTPAQVSALVASLGEMPAEAWGVEFPTRLHAASGGSPLLLIETLQLAIETGTLRLVTDDAAVDSTTGEGWIADDPARLDALLAAGSALRRRIEALERDPRWLLLVLAVAGTPLDATQLGRLAPRATGTVEEDLHGLEHRGIAARAGEAWVPAHDVIAELAIETATPDAVRAAHIALGQLLLADAGEDATRLQIAGGHFAAGGDEGAHHEAFRRWIGVARARPGSRRDARALAGEFLGGRGNGEESSGLVQHLPLVTRLGVRGRHVAVAVGVLALLATALRPLWLPSPKPDLVLYAQFRNADGSLRTVQVPLWTRDFERGEPVDVARARPAGPETDSVVLDVSAQHQPRGTAWIQARTAPDSGGVDIFLVEKGRTRRLTAYRGDDAAGSWSPDGRALVISTDRWAVSNRSDVAILDPATGAMRQLTRGPGYDTQSQWSPDGSRIAFVRRDTLGSHFVCTVSVAGEGERCTPPAFALYTGLIRWVDAEHLLIGGPDTAGTQAVWVTDETGAPERQFVLGSVYAGGENTEWAVCRCAIAPGEPVTWRVISLRDPRLQRRIAGGDSAVGILALVAPGAAAPYLDTLRIAPVLTTVTRDTRYQMRVEGRDQRGEPIAPRQIRWISLTPEVADLSSAGLLIPKGAGIARVAATAGGWRTDTALVRIGDAQPAATVREERWRSLDSSSWTPFGEPRPYLLRGPGRVPALLQNGDSSNTSGVHSSRAFDASQGLGIDVRLSTAVAARIWQAVSVDFVGGVDSTAVARWDHRTGQGPDGWNGAFNHCLASFSAAYPGVVLVGSHAKSRAVPIAGIPTDGRWWTLRLQTFPDGRCGVAVNGRVVALFDEPLPPDPRVYVLLHGNSYHTRIFFGPLDIWQGVRRDIDWEGGDVGNAAREGKR